LALLGNYSVLLKSAGTSRSGSTVSDNRSNFNNSGPARNMYTAGLQKNYGIPSGYSHPGSWVIPQTNGGAASHRQINGTGSVAASLLSVKLAQSALTGVGQLSNAALSIFVPLSASLSGSGVISNAAVSAVQSFAAALAGTCSLSAPLSITSKINAALSGVGAIPANLTGRQKLEADITPYTELSPQTLAVAVWDFDSDSISPGTIGDDIKKGRTAAENAFAVSS